MIVSVLIVEDDQEFAQELQQILDEIQIEKDIKVARSRDEALELLKSIFFDLVILDLNIPTINNALDSSPWHGFAVVSQVRVLTPGTPIFILTGSPAEEFIPGLLGQTQQVDIWSEGKKAGTIDFRRKSEFDECPKLLKSILEAVNGLSSIELNRGELTLTPQEDRLIRIFSRKFNGVKCAITSLKGGFSGSKVFRLRLTDINGVLIHDAVAKLGQHNEIENERDKFDSLVIRLDPAATPRKLATLDFGAGNLAANLYSLAGFEKTAFEMARYQDGQASETVKSIAKATSGWTNGGVESQRTIKAARQCVLSNNDLDRLVRDYQLDWTKNFESLSVQMRWSCVHGDLHGNNVLIKSDASSAVLIDYCDVKEGPCSLDPITLELSLLFHPDPINLEGWPSIAQAKQWGNIQLYLEGCPAKEFIEGCRNWSKTISAGDREIVASAYSYLMRQLKYDDTNKELIMALLGGVRSFYNST